MEQGKVLELVGSEDLEHLHRFVVAQILNEMAHVSGDHADVARHIVERPGRPFGAKDGDTRSSFDEEGPFVGVGMPVHFTHSPRANVEVSGGDGFGDGKVGRICDADEPPGGVHRLLVQHLVSELEFGLLDVGSLGLLLVDGSRQGPLEDVFVRLGYCFKDLWRHPEVFSQNRLGRVS